MPVGVGESGGRASKRRGGGEGHGGRRAYGLVFSVLGQRGVGLVHLIILGSLALTSGLLVLLERRASTFDDPYYQWTLSETLYALVLFGSLFFGVYAFFGWYFSP